MRPLTPDETRAVFEKLTKFIGENLKQLIDRADEDYCFRLHKNRIYYCSERLLKAAAHVARDELHSFGTCIGKYTHSKKFILTVTGLDLLAPYAKHKIWVKPSAEQTYLYGNNITKSGLGRITENTLKYHGVVVYSMSDIPLGFGVAAKGTADCRHASPHDIVCFHQTDIGEYLRHEDTL
ncbi:60S ribosome subunit biogenesis protein NIP7 -like protein [Halotydeus destructor]|nr:60S ribosome subunit biogenesis protein NIP7 -like protein [Halotydeus destructor]